MAKKTNFEVNGIEYYRVTKTIGHKADGTSIRKTFYGSSKSEAEEKANNYMQNLNTGLIINNQMVTINSLFPKWLFAVKKNELKPSSFESYYGTYTNYIKPYLIADLPINAIKSLKVQQYYNELTKNNASPSTVKKTHKLLKQFFSYTDKEGYIIKNPCMNISLPKEKKNNAKTIIKNKKTKFSYFSEEEIPILLKAFENNKYKDIIVFALATGMRQGEILGLQWEDVDFENKEINIIHNLNTSANILENGIKIYETKLLEPKSESSTRTIPMNDTIYNILQNIDHTCSYVFSSNGSCINAKILQKVWKKTLLDNNIPYRKFHDLRHTAATLLLTYGADLETVKEILGHSSITMTEIYVDALPRTKKEMIKKLDFILN